MLTGNRVSIDICDFANDITMPNPAQEGCYHASCNNNLNVIWMPHLPLTKEVYQTKYFRPNVITPMNICLSENNKQFYYNSNIRPYIQQPIPLNTKIWAHSMAKKQNFRLKDLIECETGNELYL